MSIEQAYDNYDLNYERSADTDYRGAERPNTQKRKPPTQGRKRGKAPSSMNGMHRRRRRKMAW